MHPAEPTLVLRECSFGMVVHDSHGWSEVELTGSVIIDLGSSRAVTGTRGLHQQIDRLQAAGRSFSVFISSGLATVLDVGAITAL